jgi:hypothetical protein
MQWDEEETILIFCIPHVLDYFDWRGSDREFVKVVARPKSGNKEEDLRALL